MWGEHGTSACGAYAADSRQHTGVELCMRHMHCAPVTGTMPADSKPRPPGLCRCCMSVAPRGGHAAGQRCATQASGESTA